jgi:hypothetical protein
MSLFTLVTDYIGLPTTYAGEVIIYTLSAILLLMVIESMSGIFYAIVKLFK